MEQRKQKHHLYLNPGLFWQDCEIQWDLRIKVSDPIYQPLRSGKIWHKVNFLSGV